MNNNAPSYAETAGECCPYVAGDESWANGSRCILRMHDGGAHVFGTPKWEWVRGQSRALTDVLSERHRQDLKWGGPEHDDEHVPTEWKKFIEARLGYGLNVRLKPYRQRMVEIAALAIAALESFDRKAECEALVREGRDMIEENRPRQGE